MMQIMLENFNVQADPRCNGDAVQVALRTWTLSLDRPCVVATAVETMVVQHLLWCGGLRHEMHRWGRRV